MNHAIRQRGHAPRPGMFWLLSGCVSLALITSACDSSHSDHLSTSSSGTPQNTDSTTGGATTGGGTTGGTTPGSGGSVPGGTTGPSVPVDPDPNSPVPGDEAAAGAPALTADINVDTDRNGAITADDARAEDKWSAARGAVLIANVDDDDGDGEIDAKNNMVDDPTDRFDMAPVILKQTSRLRTNYHAITLTVSNASAAARVRIFADQGNGVINELYAPEEGQVTIPIEWLRRGDVPLYVEAIEGRSPAWDGTMTLALTITARGQNVSTDSVAMRVGPTILPDNTQAPERVYVMRIADARDGPNLPFYNALHDHLPDGVGLYTADDATYGGDRWVQDNMQVGYQEWPTANGRTRMVSYVQLERPTGPQGLERLVPDGLLKPNEGYFYPGTSHETSLNFGGNLEVAPPHSTTLGTYPYGRVVVGGGDNGTLLGVRYKEHMGSEQRRWIDAQGIQGPSFEVSTQWLAVGHVDEVFLFIPDRNPAHTRPWKVIISSPAMAIAALTDLAHAGKGTRAVFAGRSKATTVNGILNDTDLMTYNQAAQTRIDSVRAMLQQELGLSDDDFIDVPVMYEYSMYDGLDLGVSLDPGIQNLTVVGNTLFIPDPEGPRQTNADVNTDVWRAATLQGLNGLGLNPIFVDVFESYHELMGEAHCGTNVLTNPYNKPWWMP